MVSNNIKPSILMGQRALHTSDWSRQGAELKRYIRRKNWRKQLTFYIYKKFTLWKN